MPDLPFLLALGQKIPQSKDSSTLSPIDELTLEDFTAPTAPGSFWTSNTHTLTTRTLVRNEATDYE